MAFPNFGENIEYLRAMFAVAELGDNSPRLDPMLFNGPPGVGKSLYADHLKSLFGSGFRRINMENAQSNAQLAGSDEFWSNSKHGGVFEMLVDGDWANPVFLIDEVDKVSARMEYDPLAALYGLLEPSTATCFRDQSMPAIQLDASRILWILTSNEAERIPEPIRSRVRQFDIEKPTRDQSLRVLQIIYEQVQAETKSNVPMEPLSEEIIDALVDLPPRRQKQLLREVIGRALYCGRNWVTLADLRMPPESRSGKNGVGYYSGNYDKPLGFY